MPCLHALPQVPQQRDLNWLSWQSFSCFTFSQYLVVSLHSTGKGGTGWGRGTERKCETQANGCGQLGTSWGPSWAPASCAGGATAVHHLWAGLALVELSHLSPRLPTGCSCWPNAGAQPWSCSAAFLIVPCLPEGACRLPLLRTSPLSKLAFPVVF